MYRLKTSLFASEVESINGINSKTRKIQKRLAAILEKTELEFMRVRGDVYRSNLRLVDGDLELILSECLMSYYKGEERVLSEMAKRLDEKNPCGYEQGGQPYYSFKLKKFLVEHALGMVPNTVWLGDYDATGGYIIVKENGDLVSYHLMRKNLFEQYLFHNTKFDTISTKTARGDFGHIYEEDGAQYIALNLMVKFLE